MALPPRVRGLEKHLADLPSEQLFELAEDLERLQLDNGWQALQGIVGVAQENTRRSMERGKPLEQAEYAQIMGFLNGVVVQPDLIHDVIAAAADRRLSLEREAAAESERAEQSEASV